MEGRPALPLAQDPLPAPHHQLPVPVGVAFRGGRNLLVPPERIAAMAARLVAGGDVHLQRDDPPGAPEARVQKPRDIRIRHGGQEPRADHTVGSPGSIDLRSQFLGVAPARAGAAQRRLDTLAARRAAMEDLGAAGLPEQRGDRRQSPGESLAVGGGGVPPRLETGGEVRAWPGGGERQEPGGVRLALEAMPELAHGVGLVDVLAREGPPGLPVDRREVNQPAAVRVVLHVAGVPLRIELPPQARRQPCPVVQRPPLLALRGPDVPDAAHAGAVDQHHGGIHLADREIAVLAHLGVEQVGRILEIDLVDVVVDRAAVEAGELGNGKAVIGEPGQPLVSPKAGDVLHQVDFVDAGRVAVALDRPQQHAFGAELTGLGAHEDAHRGLPVRRVAGADVENHLRGPVLRRRASSGLALGQCAQYVKGSNGHIVGLRQGSRAPAPNTRPGCSCVAAR